MSNLVATAERLRIVKDACQDFITLWALDQIMAEPHLTEQIYGDIINAPDNREITNFSTCPGHRFDD